MLRLFVALSVVVVAVVLGVEAVPLPDGFIMPWFCLQRCNFTVSEIKTHAETVMNMTENGTVVTTAVAFERFNLGPNATLIDNSDLFDLNRFLQTHAHGRLIRHRIAMISSYPYPPQFLTWMRQLFAQPDSFITTLVDQLVRHNIDGVNIDFEPTVQALPQDAIAYSVFLTKLQNALAEHGKIVTVAVARWSTLWNFTLLAQHLAPSSASRNIPGYVFTMNTYTYRDSVFKEELMYSLGAFDAVRPSGVLAIGLETWPTSFTAAELKYHFDQLASNSVCRIGIWDMPFTTAMIPYLMQFTHRCKLVAH